ncbi:non-ribosomal peptide synthetase [Xanthomonas translucens]|uniref:non-ribosomal peptide synthetase n=1 Tax=Xanthomonas campestris pv. translucens TaxID=343 RepID=UPI000641EEC9|nr:non-ribosomal peptide synthetase [Xanthomonas translucens]AKK66314.1 carboligase [Xanthomonas translucens pv. undulosa]MCT8271426.1 non-ribosomal peptide synthetase [Xanthomonas translucens pv. undulosa]WNJ29688.1 non-ribosomal peptide synthetase [Xanthomonas translucens pv. undulosa]
MKQLSCDSMPLTIAQRGLWVAQKINPKASLILPEVLELCGPIQPQLILRASRQVVCEFEPIRTRIVEENGMPRQRVEAEYLGDFPYLDLSGKAAPRQAAERWIAQAIERQWDIARDPLWSCVLFRLGEDHYLWVQYAHHIMMDGYSGGMAAQRLAELYSAYAAGVEPPASTAGVLAGLVELEASYRESERCRRDRDYWMQQLANPPPAVRLTRRPGALQCGSLRSTGYLSSAQIARLRELGALYGATLPQLLIALVAAFYHRNTGAEDLIFGMPVTGRVNRQYRSTPGMVANAVSIRLAMAPQAPFHSLFAQVASVVRSALRHQQYRYEDLRRALGLVRNDQQLAWLAVNIEAFDYALDFGGVQAIPHNLSNGSFEDLTRFFYERGNGADVRFDFDANPGLYTREELDEHRRRLLQLVDSVLDDPTQALGQVDMLGAQERARLLYDWNRNDAALPEPSSLPHWFAQQAAATPDAVAVRCASQALDYRSLQQRSAQLAAQWVEEGMSPGDVIAVALPRSAQLLVVLLAVMWSGATYLPLDPLGPAERNATILKDSGAIALVCEPAQWEQHALGGIVWLDPQAGTDRAALPAPRATADGIAYLLYTSGSTGTPKGVEVSHRNLASFLFAMQEELQLQASDRVLALTTISFDIAALELYLPLICGASAVVAGDGLLHDPHGLSRLIARERISLMQATPSLWRILLANEDLPLQQVHALVGGETLSGELATRLLQRSARLTHLYGPTETTVWSTVMRLTPAETASVPIGRPLRNTRVYVLDGQQQPVPTGASGELYIGGAGVTKGYRKRQQLNDASFLPDPFVADGGRMYRTGDLARWREDGVLEFLGRADAQLKIRGHRVEPGEVEAALLLHPAIAAAAVVGHRDGDSAMQLVAYLVAAGDAMLPTLDALRQQLQARLPEHMLPTVCMALPALPRTPNGKLDRKALPVPGRAEAPRYVAPRTALEQRLVALWQRLLGVERIGVHDNFFELGGDSLTAAELLARFPSHFGIELPLGSLFDASTVAGLATLMENAEESQNDPLAPLLRLRRGDHGNRPLFCIHPVVGLGWSYLGPGCPVYALQSPALCSGAALPDSIETIAADYLRRIRCVQPQGPYRLLGWSLGGLIVHAMAAELRAGGHEVELLVMLDAYPYAHADRIAALGDDAARMRAAVSFLGLRLDPDQPVPADLADLSTLLCDHYGLLSLPLVQQLLQDDPQLMDRIAALTEHQLALAGNYQPQRVDVDLLFFEAAIKPAPDLSQLLQQRPEAWRDFVAELDVRPVDSDHQSMLQSAPAAQIAQIVDARLHPRQSGQRAPAAAPRLAQPWPATEVLVDA